jgi:hypothetical protein
LVESFQPLAGIYLGCDPTVNGFSKIPYNGFITFLRLKLPFPIERFNSKALRLIPPIEGIALPIAKCGYEVHNSLNGFNSRVDL